MFDQPFSVPALLLGLLAIPMILGMVPRNRLYGVRTARTLASDTVWYRVNRMGGAATVLAGLIYALVAMARPYDRSATDNLSVWAIHLAGWILPLAIGLAATVGYSRRVAERVER